MPFQPRPKQQEVLSYRGGRMGVAAVPGSGKTATLSALAARLVVEGQLGDDQEVLIVTLVNAAMDNFNQRVGSFVREAGLLPNIGYRVRTLHGLCNDIVRERPGLVGLSDNFAIVDEREGDAILRSAVDTWLRLNPLATNSYLAPDLEDNRRDYILREQWGDTVLDIARAFVKQAKDYELTPDDVRRLLDHAGQDLPLAELGYGVYVQYERGLTYRGAVDFQDLIRLAVRALTLEPTYLARLRRRWPVILEDEAQDSSLLQEKILRLLAGESGNWVRVGDPNQAIYETFTTARPENLWNFLAEPDVQRRELPNSGRSSVKIIDLANYLIDWVGSSHPNADVRRRAPLQPPHIEPTPPGDPQPNPPADESRIFLREKGYTPHDEVLAVVRSLIEWLPQNPDKTAAVLVPRNKRGFDVVDALKQSGAPVEYVELLRSTTSTREAAGALANILKYLSEPGNSQRLATVYKVWRRDERDDEALADQLDAAVRAIRRCPLVEDYIHPQLGRDWLDEDEALAELFDEMPDLRDKLVAFRRLVQTWQRAVLLPVDQLILILAGDLFTSEADLAIAHSLAVMLRRFEMTHPEARLPEFVEELAIIARNERKFLGMSEDDRGFDPDRHRGKVTIATMHSAKGLEWDRVYLMSVNTYDFPSAMPGDQYMSEKWFLRDRLNIQAEALEQLAAAIDGHTYIEGEATAGARIDYTAERLRLLYVGITRARRELIMTWNTGRRGDQQASLAYRALGQFAGVRVGE